MNVGGNERFGSLYLKFSKCIMQERIFKPLIFG